MCMLLSNFVLNLYIVVQCDKLNRCSYWNLEPEPLDMGQDPRDNLNTLDC